tara:strand:- start:258 stop:1244 length:987 start_codon:yes stop_codon:yes gene_type:complete
MASTLNNKKYNIAITGANGFIGQHLTQKLIENKHSIKALVRRKTFDHIKNDNLEEIIIDDITDSNIILKSLENVDIIFHLVGKTHSKSNKYDEYYKTNVLGTKVLSQAALEANVKKIIMLSSVKVNGEGFLNKNFVYKEKDEPAPLDNYGKSKLEAEKILSSSLSKEPMGYVILRAPLVYGQNVKGNLKNLMQYIYKGLPLPIPQEDNRRSMIGIENLCDAMISCAFCEKATKNIFLVSDDVVVSTRYLFNEIAKAMKKKPILLYVPYHVLKLVFWCLGKSNSVDKLFYSLEVDNALIKNTTGWNPNTSFEKEIKNMVDSFQVSINIK